MGFMPLLAARWSPSGPSAGGERDGSSTPGPASSVSADVQLQLLQRLQEEGGRLADEVELLAQRQAEPAGVEVQGQVPSLALLQPQPPQGDLRELLCEDRAQLFHTLISSADT